MISKIKNLNFNNIGCLNIALLSFSLSFCSFTFYKTLYYIEHNANFTHRSLSASDIADWKAMNEIIYMILQSTSTVFLLCGVLGFCFFIFSKFIKKQH